MVCIEPKPIYISHSKEGIGGVVSRGDAYTIGIEWTQAYPDIIPYHVIYNIYYSTIASDVFSEGVKCVALDGYAVDIPDLTPGDTYYFAVRATEYDPNWYDPNLLPDGFPYLKVYPEASLTTPLTTSSSVIYITDVETFPSKGIIQIGLELIRYSSKDLIDGCLILNDVDLDRGFLNTNIRYHDIDGYDGYETQSPFVRFWKGYEETNVTIYQGTCGFAYPHFARTDADGYREKLEDGLNTDLSGSDASQIDFLRYDYSGYHRTDPLSLLNGECVGTYFGGEQYCADGYDVGAQIRGVSFSDENNRRQEILLDVIGEPCVLLRRLYKGIVCSCIEPTTENPALRCPFCFGTGIVGGYEQYFNPRRSDGRIMVRFGPTEDEIKMEDEGLESSFIPDCWTLVVPSLKTMDVVIRFNEDMTEEFRYRVMSVNRNKLLNSISGGQKFKIQRVRRTDSIYQWSAISDTSTMPETITTGIGMTFGPGGILPHTHTVTIHEGIITLSQINETTSVSKGHSHEVRNGVVQEVLGHSHSLII